MTTLCILTLNIPVYCCRGINWKIIEKLKKTFQPYFKIFFGIFSLRLFSKKKKIIIILHFLHLLIIHHRHIYKLENGFFIYHIWAKRFFENSKLEKCQISWKQVFFRKGEISRTLQRSVIFHSKVPELY